MKNKMLAVLITAVPMLTYATTESAGLVNEPFIIANKTKALLYYQYSCMLNGTIGGITMRNSKTSGSGTVASGGLQKVAPMISFGGKNEIWGSEIDLRLSIDPKVKWFSAMVAPAAYAVTQDANDETILQLRKLLKTAEGQYKTPEGDVPLTALTPAQEKELASQKPKGSSLHL